MVSVVKVMDAFGAIHAKQNGQKPSKIQELLDKNKKQNAGVPQLWDKAGALVQNLKK